MIDYMKSGFDLLEDENRDKMNNNRLKNNNKPFNKINNRNDVETAEEYYELKTRNTSDYSTETFESLEFAEDDVDLVKPVQPNAKYKFNKNKK